MKIIVPMAGMGKRMRPHTLTTPKPLLPIGGKPMVQHIVEELAGVCDEQVEEIAYIIGDFGKEVENELLGVAEELGATGVIYYQEEPLGTAHAILCAADSLKGKVIVAFADTLFKADFKIDREKDGIIWVHRVENPESFGVVKVNEDGLIADFIEKPKEFVSDLAIIGIYYFKDGTILKNELQYLIDQHITQHGEYQLTNALENMKNKGMAFAPGKVDEWLDCGNKDATVYTNQRILELNKNSGMISESLENTNSSIIEPCYIGEDVSLVDSEIGPHVSIGDHCVIQNSVIKNSIIQNHAQISDANLSNSMIGNFVEYQGNNNPKEVSIGDYSTQKNR